MLLVKLSQKYISIIIQTFNEQSFLDDVSIQQWNYESQDVNVLFNDFSWRLKGCVVRHAPLKKLNKKQIKLQSKPWISKEILKQIKDRNKLFVKMKKNLLIM